LLQFYIYILFEIRVKSIFIWMKSFFWVCLSSLTYLTRLKFFNVFFFFLSFYILSQRSSEKSRLFTCLLTLARHCSTDDLFSHHIHCFKTSSSFLLWKISNTDKDDLMSIMKRKRRILLKSYRSFFFSLVRLLFWSVNTYNARNETISNAVNVLIIYANNLTYKVEKVSILHTYTYKLVSM
jgi:hypothetical protein